MNVLIVYGTTEGHTRHVCQYLQDALADDDVSVTVCDVVWEPTEPESYDLCFIAASLHVGSYQPTVVEYARHYHEALNGMPTAFLSVSLSAAGENPDDWAGLDECVDRFLHATLWKPTVVHHVAGAIRYSHYDFFKRLALKFIAHRRGRETVTSSDYDLTDYEDLRGFAAAFVSEHRPVDASENRATGERMG
jgi:menaquinone-dependent protoporphyrinogen oxidase